MGQGGPEGNQARSWVRATGRETVGEDRIQSGVSSMLQEGVKGGRCEYGDR